MTQFDPYLSALGLMTNNAWPGGGYTGSGAPEGVDFTQGQNLNGITGYDSAGKVLPGAAGQNSIQDWFSGSRYLMNLMEAGDDSQMPDLPF